MALCCPDPLLAAETLPWRHVLVLAAVNGRDHAEGRIPIRRLQVKTKMRPSTIRAILTDLENDGYLVRERGYSTGTTNREGKRLATGRLLALSARFAGTSWTAIPETDYENLPTAGERFDALRAAMLERALRGLVLTHPRPVREFVSSGTDTEGEHLPTPSVLTLDVNAESQGSTNALCCITEANGSERAPAAPEDQRKEGSESQTTTADDSARVPRPYASNCKGARAGATDGPRARRSASGRPTRVRAE